MAKSKKTSPKQVAAERAAVAKAAAVSRAQALRETRTGKHLGGFMDFIREQGIIGLAIGLVIGVQVKAVVDSLVASFINPLVGLILPGSGRLSDKTFSLTIGGNTQNFTYGAFTSVFISFLVIAAVIYFVVKGLKLDKLDKKKA